MSEISDYQCDVLIIGSGAAGLSLALRPAQTQQVMVLSKGPVSEGSSFYAQGGIAAVFDEMDSIEAHVEDTLVAGAGLCDRDAVDFIARNARHCVEWLIEHGVAFDKETQPDGEERYHLTREGGHSHRRILHSADATGREVVTTLVSQAMSHPNIRIPERTNAVDLILSDRLGLPGSRRVLGAGSGTAIWSGLRPAARAPWCWPPAAQRRFINIPPIPTSLLATASLWPARRLPRREHGIQSVPSNLPVSSTGA